MNELKYNLYFAQLLLNIKEGRDIEKSCEDINKELTRVWLKSQGFTVKHCDSGVWTDTIQW